MTYYLLLQIGLPLGLLAWLWLWPPSNRLGLILLALAAASWITAAELAGLWLFVPYWLTSIFALALLGGAWRAWRSPSSGLMPAGVRAWLWPALCLALTVGGAAFIADWFQGHRPPSGEVVELAKPLRGENYRVVNGGSSAALNAHLMTLDRSVPRFRLYVGQSYGVDIVRLNKIGRTTHGLRPSDPAAYAIFGDEVLAPCAGKVVAALDGRPDMPVPQMDRTVMMGNHVIVACGAYHILLGHLRAGSVLLRTGAMVEVGQEIGQVGNSGNSAEPHLHIHAQRAGSLEAPISGAPVPITIEGRYLVRNETL